jgi:hypothetical protein
VITEGELIAIDQTAFHVLTRSGFQSVTNHNAARF